MNPENKSNPVEITAKIYEILYTVYDPEIPVNVVELGLIYDIVVNENGHVNVLMTLTAPGCPVAGDIVAEVEEKAGSIEGVEAVEVELTFEPAWTMDMMSEEAKLELGFL